MLLCHAISSGRNYSILFGFFSPFLFVAFTCVLDLKLGGFHLELTNSIVSNQLFVSRVV